MAYCITLYGALKNSILRAVRNSKSHVWQKTPLYLLDSECSAISATLGKLMGMMWWRFAAVSQSCALFYAPKKQEQITTLSLMSCNSFAYIQCNGDGWGIKYHLTFSSHGSYLFLGVIHKLCSSFFENFDPSLPPSSLTWTFWRPP